MNEFEIKLDKWLTEVADKCHEIASNQKFDLDFYVFQSDVFYRPKLMFIGANPGGGKLYSEKNREEKRTKRSKFELGEGENTFIKYYNDKNWIRLRPLYDMFNGDSEIEKYFKEAVITNLSYFNSGTFKVLNDKMKIVGKEPLDFCIRKNIELIKDIIQPQNLIIMGATARDYLSKYLNEPLITILETKSNENTKSVPLIKKSSFSYSLNSEEVNIPVYVIEHPSAWNGLNSNENTILKQKEFEKILKI